MASTIGIPFDLEASRRRVTDLLDGLVGGSEGHISEVSLGTRIVKIPSQRPLFRAAPEGSYMARKYEEFKWPPKVYGDPIPEMQLLLDRIHRYHLQALSLMTKEAVSRHARGMILAGYTYGLLPDPVANILANAFWYDSTFPPSPEEEAQSVKMLSAKAIFRMAARSLDALIAFLRHFAPALSIREICRFLAMVDGNLQDAVSLLHDRAFGLVEQAGSFLAAVQASDLPSDAVREAHLSFVTRYDSARDILVKHSGSVSSDLRISSLYPPRVPCDPYHVGYHVRHTIPGTSTSSSLSPSAYRALRLKMHSFRMEEELSLDLVSLALQNLALQFGESYELHMVCGKNYIIMPRSRGDYYHINFLASPEGGSSPPKLFFAEVRGVFKDVNDVTLCYPLTEEKASAAACQQEYGVCEEDQQTSFSSSKSTSRCLGCDTKGIKLIHPADVRFNGAEDGSKDHKAFAASSMPDPTLEFGAPLNEDYVFFSLKQHPWTAAFLEDSYSYMSDDQVDLSFMWVEDYLP